MLLGYKQFISATVTSGIIYTRGWSPAQDSETIWQNKIATASVKELCLDVHCLWHRIPVMASMILYFWQVGGVMVGCLDH